MVSGFVMFLAMRLLGLAMRLDQAGFWVLAPGVFYQIMTLHGAGMVTAALILPVGDQIEVLNGSTPLDARLLWAAYVVGYSAVLTIAPATIIGGVGAGWTMMYPLPYRAAGQWTITAAMAVYVGYFLTTVAFLLCCIAFLRGTAQAAAGLDPMFVSDRRPVS